MPETELRAFVNERGVTLAPGSIALDAVRALFPDAAIEIEAGSSRLTDACGRPTDAWQPLVSGAIYRVLPARERGDADSAGETP